MGPIFNRTGKGTGSIPDVRSDLYVFQLPNILYSTRSAQLQMGNLLNLIKSTTRLLTKLWTLSMVNQREHGTWIKSPMDLL